MRLPAQLIRSVLTAVLAVVTATSAFSCSRPAPAQLDFTLKDMHGNDVRLADFKGRPVLINLWATYCVPCKAEIPDLVYLYEKYKATGFVVLGVSVGDTESDLKTFVANQKMTYPVLLGDGADDFLAAYRTYAIPTSWFIHKDGTILEKRLGIGTRSYLEQQIRRLM